jgi:hypothetical protein
MQDINPQNKCAGEIAVQSGELVNKNFEKSRPSQQKINAKRGYLQDRENGQESLNAFQSLAF